MNVDVEINGRRRVVSIEPVGDAGPAGGRFHVRLVPAEGGEPVTRDVDVRTTDLGVSILDRATHRSLDVALTPGRGGTWLVQLPHVSLTATVDGRRLRPGALDAADTGAQRITSPMPGRVVKVLVTPGQRVEARQPVIVIEAMKMENELSAVHPGTVVEVAVRDGAPVEAGRLLVRIESPPKAVS